MTLFFLFLFFPKCLVLETASLETCFEEGYVSATATVFTSIPPSIVFHKLQNFHVFRSNLTA